MRTLLITACLAAVVAPISTAQDERNQIGELNSRLDAQAAEIRELRALLEEQPSLYGVFPDPDASGCGGGHVRRLALVAEQPVAGDCGETGGAAGFLKLDYYADYDRGFVIRAFDPSEHPFSLKVNGWIQFRHHGFVKDTDSWTDNAGVTRPIRDRNAFDIERGRLIFSGHAVDKRLTYFLHLDGDTDGGEAVDFFDYWWGWQLTESLQLQFGKRKVPASRQWLLTARNTRFVDRPMADDFFRPDRTVGMFAIGKVGETGHYELMAGNGYRTANLPDALSDDRMTFAATNYCDPFGPFGGQIVDFEGSSEALARIGHSFVYSPQTSDTKSLPLSESDFIRLADGTRLTQSSALAPGATVSEFDVFFYGIDAAFKCQGWSLNAEGFVRWIENLEADAPLPMHDILQHGYYVEGGRFLIPGRLDANLRYSQVSDEFGTASEMAAGCNWYPLAKPTVKISFDVSSLDGSPVQNTTSDTLAGEDGTLFRTQFQAEF